MTRRGCTLEKLQYLSFEITRGQSDQGSSLCSRPQQNRARTRAAHRRTHKLPRELGAESLNQRPDRLRCRTTCVLCRPVKPLHTPSYTVDFRHVVFMSRRFTKKSLVSISGRLVKTPCAECPKFAFNARMPPIRTVISGAVSVSRLALSTSSSAADPSWPFRMCSCGTRPDRLQYGKRVHIGLLL